MAQQTAGGPADADRRPPHPLKVFISYRREDVPDATYRLVEGLEARFGVGNVFVDVDHISPGRPFAEVIAASVAKSDVFLAIIGDRWLGKGPKGGALRIKTAGDFVRLEIEAALEHGIPVVPVLIGGAAVPRREDLPESMATLPDLQAFQIARSHWGYDIERLESAIAQIADTGVPPSALPRRDRHGAAAEARRRRTPSPAVTITVTVAVTIAVAVAAIMVVASKGPGGGQGSASPPATSAPASTGTTSVASTTTPVQETAPPATTTPARPATPPATTTPARAATPPVTPPSGPEQIVSRYWQEIGAHRFGAAYAYLDPEYRQGESKSAFVEKHEAEGIKEAKFHGESVSDDGSSATVDVTSLRTNDAAKGCREWNGHYAMRSVAGHWLIHEAQIEAFRHCHG